MKSGAINHPKMEQLAELLGLRLREAVGIMEMLFSFTNQYAPRGDVGRFSNAQLARRCDWDDDPDALIGALLAVRWLDPHRAHRFVVHDWPDHAAEYTKKKAKADGWAVDDDEPPETEGESASPENSGIFQTPVPENSGLPSLAKPSLAKPSLEIDTAGTFQNGSRPKKSRASPFPTDPTAIDAIRAELSQWLALKPEFSHIDLEYQLERAAGYSKANGKRYVNWSEAIKNAIRDNWWPKAQGPPGATATEQKDFESRSNFQRVLDGAVAKGSTT